MTILMALLALATEPHSPCDTPEAVKPNSEAVLLCELAISRSEGAPRVKLLNQRAFAFNERNDAPSAIKDLDAALAIDPNDKTALFERAYSNNDIGNHDRALVDLTTAERLFGLSTKLLQERSFAFEWKADFLAAAQDRTAILAGQPDDLDTLFGRANVYAWLGRFEDARADLMRARAIASRTQKGNDLEEIVRQEATLSLLTMGEAAGAAERCAAAMRANRFDSPTLIGDCTRSYLAATTSAKRAEALTIRALAWQIGQQDSERAFVDTRIAAAVDPKNAAMRTNYGFRLVQKGRSWAGEREFDAALAIDPKSWAALAGRAQARHRLGKLDGAFADGRRSFELHPNEIALIEMGDILHQRGDDKAAKMLWLSAYNLGSRNDDLIANLHAIGVADIEAQAAKLRK